MDVHFISTPIRSSGTDNYATEKDWNVRWPINRLALSALRGVGMTDTEIGEYYRVPVNEVAEMREICGIR